MSTDETQQPAPPVPVAAAPPPDAPPQPGVPTMNLLETDTKAITGGAGPREGRAMIEIEQG